VPGLSREQHEICSRDNVQLHRGIFRKHSCQYGRVEAIVVQVQRGRPSFVFRLSQRICKLQSEIRRTAYGKCNVYTVSG